MLSDKCSVICVFMNEAHGADPEPGSQQACKDSSYPMNVFADRSLDV